LGFLTRGQGLVVSILKLTALILASIYPPL
jgi:hypothetical protein